MNIIKSIQARWRNGQKGAVLVLTALLLPVMIAVTGFAVDGGNLYYQKSRLQNAADAAALAGAQAYVDNNENESYAERVTRRYINGVYHNLEKDEDVDIPQPEVKTSSDKKTKYYIVTIKKDVPLYFLAGFVGPSQEVKAHSIAAITKTSGSSSTPSPLFIFDEAPDLPRSLDNPDNDYTPGQIKASYNGSIYTSGNPKDVSCLTGYKIPYFFTKEAVDKHMSIKEAIQANYYTLAKQVTNLMNDIESKVKSMMKSTDGTDYHDQNYKSFNAADANKGNRLQVYESANLDNFTIKGLKKSSTPLILYFSSQYGSVANISIEEDIERPIIIYSPSSMKLMIELRGHIFHGVICAPNMTGDVIHTVGNNGKYGTFYGTIAAKKVKIDNEGTFNYEDILHMSSSDYTSQSNDSSATVSLVNDNEVK